LHRTDRFPGMLLFDSCAALVDGEIALQHNGRHGLSRHLRGPRRPILRNR
jgi:hypothetical protein